MSTLQKKFGQLLSGLWRNPDFVRLWSSLTISSYGAQITNLALPLTAALMLDATPWQMGVLVALETLPFALVSLHAGVLIDRVRKLPIVIAADIGRGLALLAIPATAFSGTLSIEIIYAVAFVCGVQNVVGGAAYQVLLAQMAGRRRLVEANAKVALGETSAALVGPGLAGGLIQLVTAPFAIALGSLTFVGSALMLRRIREPHDEIAALPRGDAPAIPPRGRNSRLGAALRRECEPPIPPRGRNSRLGAALRRSSVGTEIMEGLKLVRNNRTLLALAWTAALWQILHHMQVAVLILFATRELGLSAGAIGLVYAFGGVGCVVASALAQRLSARFGVGPVIVHGLALTALGWQAFGLVSGRAWVAALGLGAAMLVFDFGAVLYGITYLALRQAITPDRLLGRMTATMRFLTVAAAPLGSLAGGALATEIGLRATLLTIGVLGIALVACAVMWSPVRRHREMPAVAND